MIVFVSRAPGKGSCFVACARSLVGNDGWSDYRVCYVANFAGGTKRHKTSVGERKRSELISARERKEWRWLSVAQVWAGWLRGRKGSSTVSDVVALRGNVLPCFEADGEQGRQGSYRGDAE